MAKKTIKTQDQAQDKALDQIQVVAQDQAQDQAQDHAQVSAQVSAQDQSQDQDQSQSQSQDHAQVQSVDLLALIHAPKTKKESSQVSAVKIEKKSFKTLEDQINDYASFSLSVFGQVVSLNDIKTKCTISKDFEDQVKHFVHVSAVGSIHDDHLSALISYQGSSAINMIDHQIFAFSKGYDTEKKRDHQGLYSWQVSKFLKLVCIAQAIKVQKSLRIDTPQACSYVSLSWGSFAQVLASLGCSSMSSDRKEKIKAQYGSDLVNRLDNTLMQIDLNDLFKVFSQVPSQVNAQSQSQDQGK